MVRPTFGKLYQAPYLSISTVSCTHIALHEPTCVVVDVVVEVDVVVGPPVVDVVVVDVDVDVVVLVVLVVGAAVVDVVVVDVDVVLVVVGANVVDVVVVVGGT